MEEEHNNLFNAWSSFSLLNKISVKIKKKK